MALDAVFLRALTEELRPRMIGVRIDKIHQPARDQIILSLRGNQKLLLCAGANAPRIQFSKMNRENPSTPPMFCMLLRKRLSGGRIAALDQPPMERLIRLEIDTADELGRPGRHTLVLEAMGRRSNLILLDGEGRIVDCLRRVDAELSASRQVLPGLYYRPPAAGDRLPLTEETEAGFREKLSAADPERPVDKFLLDRYFGISPLLAREIAFRACGDTDARLFSLNGTERLSANGAESPPDGKEALWQAFRRLREDVEANRFTPICLKRNGRPFEFACFPILQYGPSMEIERFPDFSSLLDEYYAQREQEERARVRGAELVRAASAARERLKRKLALQEQDYAATQNRDELRICGDLITANLYRMERGERVLACENFYGARYASGAAPSLEKGGGGDHFSAPTVSIPLDPLLTPQQNAAKYYKRYNKAKTAEKYLKEQIALARRDLDYLESVLEELRRAETEQDFLEIREELRQSGFLRQAGKDTASGKGGSGGAGKKSGSGGKGKSGQTGKPGREKTGRPREFRTRSGFAVWVGRSNRQNDALTKNAERGDIWLHTQKIHGSHVILRTEGRTADPETVREAAAIAAYYSQGRESANVPVDYTPVRYVRKPAGGRPGAAVYTTYQTVYVTPRIPEAKEP